MAVIATAGERPVAVKPEAATLDAKLPIVQRLLNFMAGQQVINLEKYKH